MAKEIPILFSTPMVQAILAGSKTETRRVLKPQAYAFVYPSETAPKGWPVTADSKKIKCPYGVPGDVLWVREQFSLVHPNIPLYDYKATNNDENTKWKPSIHMPKDAARIWLQVESISVERLKNITEESAKAEGFACITKDDGRTYKYGIPDADGLPGDGKSLGWVWSEWDVSPKIAFHRLWEKINGAESFEGNQWVWVVKFKVLSTTGKPANL